MIKKFLFLLLSLLSAANYAQAAQSARFFETDSYTDIFISSQKADITVTPARGQDSGIIWNPKLCVMTFRRPSKDVVKIDIEPRKQNAFFQKMLMIPHSRCSVELRAGAGKNIYASSQSGDIRFFYLNSKLARAYSGQGVVETLSTGGDFAAETLTDKINIREFNGGNLSLKTASGNIAVTGKAKNISLLNTSGESKLTGFADTLMFYSSQGGLNAKWESLPENALNISAHSFSGNIKLSLPKADEKYKEASKLDLKTFYGNIVVEERRN